MFPITCTSPHSVTTFQWILFGHDGLISPIARSTGGFLGCLYPTGCQNLVSIYKIFCIYKGEGRSLSKSYQRQNHLDVNSRDPTILQLCRLFLLSPCWFIMWILATATLQPVLFIFLYSKHSSTSSSWIADWSLSNLSTWTKVVWDPWTKRPKSTLH